ncbi:MAG: CSLREA domain-containing protein [Cyanobacteria bacterium P01_F01_bin.33]
MNAKQRASVWTTVGGVCTVVLIACGSETVTLAPVTNGVATSENSTGPVGFTSALFGSDGAVSLSSSAEMLAAYNLPAGAANENNVSTAARLLLDPEGALRPIENLPELANADVAQPAGLLNLADVAVVLTAARAEEAPSKTDVAQQVSRILAEPGGSEPFDASDVRVVPGQEQLGDPGQPGGDALVTSDTDAAISQVIGAIDNTPVSIASDGDVVFPPGTEILYPANPDPQQALRVSFEPPLIPSRNIPTISFTAAQLNCEGARCELDGLDIVPVEIDPAPGDYAVTYAFRYSDGGNGFIEETAVRVLSVLRADLAPPPTPAPTPAPTPVTGGALTVNSFEDNVIADDGLVTLREAIIAANEDTVTDLGQAGSGADVIELPAGAFALTLAGRNEDAAATGDLDVAGELTIRGANGEPVTIVGLPTDETVLTDRVLHVLETGNLTLESVTIAGGAIPGANGGGMFVDNSATATLTNSTVSGNSTSGNGGGIFVERFATLTLNSSTISGNIANLGGGISSDRFSTVNLEDSSTVSDNTGSNGGGGFSSTLSSTINITDSTVSDNIVTSGGGDGGGIRSDGTINLIRSVITGNSAGANGGGIYSREMAATANVENSTITSNIAGGSGGGIRSSGAIDIANSTVSRNSATLYGGGTLITGTSGRLNITSSTIASNSVGTRDGGGVFIDNGSTATLTNSTVAGNTAFRNAGGIENRETLNATNSTVANNVAAEDGGGILTRTGDISILESTLVAENIATTNGNLSSLSGTLDVSNSLIATDADIINGTNVNNIIDVAPQLDPAGLQDNGGLTQTIGLQPTSPAIDAGSNPDNLTTDQRGEPRIVDGDGNGTATIDIGAFEFVP